jgi:phage-related baseplate assembly protein
MVDTSATFTAVDLSRLPAPEVIETLSYETLLAQAVSKFQSLMSETAEGAAEYDALLDSDPAMILLQLIAYYAMGFRARVNDGARAVMPAYAVRSDLDNLVALMNVLRLTLVPGDTAAGVDPIYESDTDLRSRFVLAPEGFSVAGPEGAYIFHARSASGEVLDASAISPDPDDIRALVLQVLADHAAAPALTQAMTAALDAASWPGDVKVTILSRAGDGTASAELLDLVSAHVSDETIRPLTDAVTVQAATIVNYAITATVTTFAGPDGSIVIAESIRRATEYAERQHRLGLDVTRSGIFAALHCEGVQNVQLSSPAFDIVIDRESASFCTAINVTYAGVGE